MSAATTQPSDAGSLCGQPLVAELRHNLPAGHCRRASLPAGRDVNARVQTAEYTLIGEVRDHAHLCGAHDGEERRPPRVTVDRRQPAADAGPLSLCCIVPELREQACNNSSSSVPDVPFSCKSGCFGCAKLATACQRHRQISRSAPALCSALAARRLNNGSASACK